MQSGMTVSHSTYLFIVTMGFNSNLLQLLFFSFSSSYAHSINSFVLRGQDAGAMEANFSTLCHKMETSQFLGHKCKKTQKFSKDDE